jgi:hypothetical protein
MLGLQLLKSYLTGGQMTLQLLNQLSLLYCAAAVVVAVAVVIIGEDQLMRGNFSSLARFLSSSCPSHAFWNWPGASCCPALLLLLRNPTLCRQS